MAFDPYHKWLGIGPAEQPPDLYRLLGLTQFETDPDVISTAADQRMTHLQSIGSGSHAAQSQKLLNEIATARLILLNAQKKLRYDEKLREIIRNRQASPQPLLVPVAKDADRGQASRNEDEKKEREESLQKYLVLGGGAAVGVVILGVLIYAFSGSSSRSDPPVTMGEKSAPPPPATATPTAAPQAPPLAVVASPNPSEEAPAQSGTSAEQPDSPSGTESAGAGLAGADAGTPAAKPGEAAASVPGKKPGRRTRKSSPSPKTPEADSSATAGGTAPLSLPDLIEKVKPAVVVVRTERGFGSGFVVDPKGIIATNYHVVDGSSQAKVVFSNGSSLNVEGYVAADMGKDMVLLRARTDRDLPSLAVADTSPRDGEDVVAIGSPKGLTFTTSQGIVSAVRSIREIVQGDASLARSLVAGGYDKDALWIQTTAPISPGNSGGPLLTRDSRVVGLNTWCQTAGQNLNFAISATHIAALMAKATTSARSLAGLPPMPLVSGERPRVSARMAPVKLSDGRELTEGTVDIPQNWAAQFGIDHQIYCTTFNNGELQSVIHFGSQGKLVGPAATLYETGTLCTLAYYRDHFLNGPLRLWSQQRQRLLYVEYKRGKKQGICCFFRRGLPWLVQECDKDEVRAQYLVRHTREGSVGRPEAELSEEEKQELKSAVEQLTVLEEQIDAGEKRIKKAVVEAFREWDKEFRQARRTEIAQGRYNTARSRVESKNAVTAQSQAFWRKALGNCGF